MSRITGWVNAVSEKQAEKRRRARRWRDRAYAVAMMVTAGAFALLFVYAAVKVVRAAWGGP